MDEMQLLRELGDRTPLTTADDLTPARERLLMTTRPNRTKRFVAYGGAVAGLAAAIFAVFALMPATGSGGGLAPAANADPVVVLKSAATAALQVPDVKPRPDQFVYIKSQEPGGTREDWFSVDGTHDGLILMADGSRTPLPGCRNGKKAVIKGDTPIPGASEACVPDPAYRPDLPTTADGMIKLLSKNNQSLNSTGKDILSMLSMTYMRPQSRAALFEAATKIEGLTAKTGVTDAVGRAGIEIAWQKDGHSGDFIVDEKTYAFLGHRKSTALLTMTIVDRAGDKG